jgi:hypothetical protein
MYGDIYSLCATAATRDFFSEKHAITKHKSIIIFDFTLSSLLSTELTPSNLKKLWKQNSSSEAAQ